MRRIVPLLGALMALLAGCVFPATGAPQLTPGTETPLPATTPPAVAAASPVAGEGFAIYLTAEGLTVAQMKAAGLGQVQPSAAPFISPGDILSYGRASHELELTPEAYDRIRKLAPPMNGMPFLVCVDRHPVYWGAFWTPLSSASFEGVVIWPPFESSGNTIRIRLGYPGPDFFEGPDPRAAPEVWQALERAGKAK